MVAVLLVVEVEDMSGMRIGNYVSFQAMLGLDDDDVFFFLCMISRGAWNIDLFHELCAVVYF